MRSSEGRLRRLAFLILAVAGWFALVSQFAIFTAAVGALAAGLLFLSYFSIVSNVLLAVVATAIAVSPNGRVARSSIPGAVAVYITIVCVIWTLFLRGSYTVTGIALLADTLMHVILPPAYVLARLLSLPKGILRPWDSVIWLILPLCYCAWMFGRGAIDGWYPYPFLNASAMGYPKAVAVAAGFVVLFWVIGLAVIFIDRVLAKRTVNAARSR